MARLCTKEEHCAYKYREGQSYAYVSYCTASFDEMKNKCNGKHLIIGALSRED